VSENAAGGANPSIRYGDVQIWVDQYIDASNADNLAKFRDADGKPVNPSIAAAAFGAPTYLIRGPASAIETNGGTGGDFVKTGTRHAGAVTRGSGTAGRRRKAGGPCRPNRDAHTGAQAAH
jgi:hypothetical protein